MLECPDYRYEYNEEGNLIAKHSKDGSPGWRYSWQGNGMLREVLRPDRKPVTFEYDGLGRRTAKVFDGQLTRWVWDGNVPLHEWALPENDRPQLVIDELGEIQWSHKEAIPPESLITWIFDEGQFSPSAKMVGDERYSTITDYLGTPVQMYDSSGQLTWDAEYDIYGNVRKLKTGSLNDCPFGYPGQYADAETGLCYNRFRYYDPENGTYISQDPISIEGGLNIYSYVSDSNIEIDPFGESGMQWHHLVPQVMMKDPNFMRQLNKITGGKAKNFIHRQGALIETGLHKAIHKGPGGGQWNQAFKDWVKDLDYDFSRKDIQKQLKKMMKDFNIPRSSRNFARKFKRKPMKIKCKGL